MRAEAIDPSPIPGTTGSGPNPREIPVVLVQRKKGEFWSIEGIFDTIQPSLPAGIHAEAVSAPRLGARLGAILQNLRWARSLPPATFHVTGDIHYAILGLRGRRRILTIHDLRFVEEARGLRRFLLWLFWVYLPCKAATRVTVISEATREALLGLVRIDPGKLRVIPNCVSPGFRPVPKGWNSVSPVLLQVGTTSNKNLERVVEASTGLDVTLWILGRLSPGQRELLERSGISFRAFHDLPPAEVVSLYEQCDLVVFASLYEGFGMPILEAQAVGRPVLTSARSPMREVAGEGALLVDPESVDAIRNGLKELLADADLRERLVQAGFANVRRYSAEAVAKQYGDLYREVAAS